jgi:hypothetical protein
VRQHDRVGLAVPDPGRAHQRLREHVVEPVAGRVDRVAGEQRAEREALAVGLARPGEGGGDAPRRLERDQRGHRVRAPCARALGRVAERVERARGQRGHGLRRGELRVVDDHGRTDPRRVLRRAPGAPVPVRHLGARERGRHRHRLLAAPGRDERLGHVDHPAAAERHHAVAGDRPEQVAGQLVHVPPAYAVHRRGVLGHVRRGRGRALRGQQYVAGPAEQPDGVVGRARAEADEPLAVLPGERRQDRARHRQATPPPRAGDRRATSR